MLLGSVSDVEVSMMRKPVNIPLEEGAVVLLGAGFSRTVGLPLMNELLERSVPEDIIEVVRYLGGFGPDRDMSIEDFLTVCDFEDALRLGGEEDNVSYLMSFAADIANSMCKMRRVPEFWESVVDILDRCGTIISLNWDTLLEIQARALGRPIVYKGRCSRDATKVLKLHGSIDWYQESRVGSLADHDFFAPLFRGYVRYRPFTEEANFFRVPQQFADLFNRVAPVIVSPTHLKAVPTGPLRQIWLQAYDALERASDVIIVGYSMPPSDHLIRLMLQRSIRYQQLLGFEDAPRITVVDPDSTGVVADRYAKVFGNDFRLVQRPFLDTRYTGT